MRTTRLAPSPTGALHLGNARTFLINWLLARHNGWKIVLRIEDIDGPRIKRGAAQGLIDDLRWLGIDWDEGPIIQSDRRPVYDAALQKLIAGGHAYACVCSRKEVEAAASAPHAEDGSAVYPGTCRGRYESIDAAREASGRSPAIRCAGPEGQTVGFEDTFAGHQSFDVARQLGDFVIAKADGTPAYQLAVVVDDAEMGITEIVRGGDLLDSTPRQILLYQALGLENRIPTYCHLPLVVGTDGRRLAKRHGDTRLSFYRDLGVSPERVLALLGRWSGVNDLGDAVTARELVGRFKLPSMSKDPITFTAADDAWLRSGATAPSKLKNAGTA
jgi:glutamyl-tRNA synthetase